MLKSTFSGLQRCRRQKGSIFIRSAVVASQICKITRNSPKISNLSRSSNVIDLGANRIRNFLLVVNSNFGRISYRFRDIDAFRSKITFSPSHPCLMTVVAKCDITAVQGHPRSSILMSIESSYATSY